MHVGSDTNRKPRVLHVNTARTWRGGEQQMVHLLRGLHQRGHLALAACRRGAPAAGRARQRDARVYELPMRCEVDIHSAFHLARIARHRNVNIFHAHTAHAHSLASLAKHLFYPRCRLVAHRRIEFYPGRGPLGLGWVKYHCGVDAFIAISDRLRDILIDAGVEPNLVHTVRSVTDPQRFIQAPPNPQLRDELGIPDDAFVVGNVGYLVPHKDHFNLLEAASRVRREIPELWVVIVGSGPLKEEIKARARELGMADRLVLTGFRNDVPQLIKMFDLFALSSSEEGICSTLFEVMACEKPIVCTNAAGVKEAVVDGRTGLVVPRRNSDALAEGILTLYNDPVLARKYARAGHQRVLKHFTVDDLTEQTLAVYRNVLGIHNRPG